MTTSQSFAVVNCGQLLTLRGSAGPRTGAELGELTILPGGALLVRNGRIAVVDSEKTVLAQLEKGSDIIDAKKRVVMPGFVDAHTHLIWAGNRADEFERRARGETYLQIAESGGGIMSTVRQTRAASKDELLLLARQRLGKMIRCGTTALEAKSGYGLSTDSELKILRVIARLREETPMRVAATFLGAHTIPAEFKERRAEYVKLVIEEMLPAVAKSKLANYCDLFCEEKAFNPDEARQILAAARNLGFKFRLHVDQLTRNGGAELAAEFGAVTADHLEQTDAAGFMSLKKAGVMPVLLPASVYGLALSKYADARGIIASGLPVVLATDFNPGSAPTPSVPMVLSLAVTQMKMSVAEAITAATHNAACSLGWHGEIGSLTPGHRADFVIHDCQDYRELACYFGIEPAAEVYVAGNCIFRR